MSRELRFQMACYAVAILIGLPSFGFPHGADGSIFQYIGAGILDGYWPYADAGDIKPPGIFVTYALGALISGGATWGIRLLELGALLLTAHLGGRMLDDGFSTKGLGGPCALLVSGWHYTTFIYWDVGQVEVWEALCTVAALHVATTRPRAGGSVSLKRLLAAGTLSGAAVMFKFPAGLLGLVVGIIGSIEYARPRGRIVSRELVRALAVFGLGSVIGVAAFVLPFVIAGHFTSMKEYLAVFVAGYAQLTAEQFTENPVAFWLQECRVLSIGFAVLAVAAAILRRPMPPRQKWVAGCLGALVVAAVMQVVSQGKYFWYHWQIVTGFAAFATVALAWIVFGRISRVVLAISLLLGIHVAVDRTYLSYRTVVAAELELLSGQSTHRDYLARFDVYNSLADLRALSTYLKKHSQPGDTLCVLGLFSAAPYVWSGLRCPSRFFFTAHIELVASKPEYFRGLAHWPSELEAALVNDRPTFLLVQRYPLPSYIGLRYTRVRALGSITLLKLIPQAK